jgi:hypothetical protein
MLVLSLLLLSAVVLPLSMGLLVLFVLLLLLLPLMVVLLQNLYPLSLRLITIL